MSAISEAIKLVRKGYYLLPLHSVKDGVCSCNNPKCGSPGKHPTTKNGVKDAVCNEKQIEAWARIHKDCNFGVATGRISGLVVVDIDNPELWESIMAEMPTTMTVRTGKGVHLYYSYPDKDVNNRVRIKEYVDLRSDGGYVVAPGSTHYSGVTYRVMTEMDPVTFPAELILTPVKNRPVDNCDHTYMAGSRNDSLYRLGRALKSREASNGAIESAIREQNKSCMPPLDEDEVDSIINQVIMQGNRGDFALDKTPPKTHENALGSIFPVVLASTFVKEHIPPLTWLLDTILPAEGLTALAAYQKSGKTTFLYPMLTAIAKGEPFMGLDVKQTNTLLMAVEEPRSIVKERLMTCGFNPDTPDETPLYLVCSGVTSSEEIIDVLGREIEEKEIKLVAIDTLATFLSLENENDNSEFIKALQPLKDLRDKYECAFLLVHHTRKNYMGDHRRAHRGASAFGGYVDQIITMKQMGKGKEDDVEKEDENDCMIKKSDTRRIIEITGRSDESPAKLVIDYDLENKIYSIVGNSIHSIRESRANRVWLALNGKAKSVKNLMEVTSMPDKTLRRYLDDLLALGQAEKVKDENEDGRMVSMFIRGKVQRKKKW